jgi:hydroxymethylpyrimidine pyrophosphatase-like HAD family hydrolase
MQGTLLNNKSQITSANARALKEAVSRGVKVVIATGKVRTIEFIDYHDIITEVYFNIIPYLGKYIFNIFFLIFLIFISNGHFIKKRKVL